MIHLVDYNNTDIRHMDHWRSMVPDLFRRYGYDVKVYSGSTEMVGQTDQVLMTNIYYKTTQFQSLFLSMLYEEINDGDIIIFADAWNPTAVSVNYFLQAQNLDRVAMVGLWREGIYDMNSKIRNGLLRKPKGWAKTFERSLYGSYDYNLFITDASMRRFMGRYRRKETETMYPIGLPYLTVKEDRLIFDVEEKENIIALTHDAFDEDHRLMWEAFEAYMPEFTFIDSHVTNMRRKEYYNLLSRSKAVMFINSAETNPTLVWEAMVFGCIPIVPDRLVYAEILDESYQYDGKSTSMPMLNFVRGRDHLKAKVNDVMSNYDKYLPKLEKDADALAIEHFNDNKWIELINKISNEFKKRK